MTSIEDKQNYLNKQILDSNYSIEEFTKFISKKKTDGFNLEKWTMSELVSAVKEFKCIHKPTADMNDTLNLSNFNPTEMQFSMDSDSKSFNSKDFGIKGIDNIGSIEISSEVKKENISDFLDEIEKKVEDDESDIKFIQDVKLTKIIQEKKNMFSSRNLYVLETIPFGWVVNRRLSDFKWLCERMTREFPDLGIPVFANQKTAKEVQTFLRQLLKHKIILKSRFLVFFLSCTSPQTFYDRRKKEFNNGFFKNLALKFTAPEPIIEKDINVLPQSNALADMMDELELREDQEEDENFKIHVFLEDLSTTARQIKSPLRKAKEVIEELCFFIEKCSEKSRELAAIFDSISQGYKILEKNKTQEMNSLDIKIGDICSDLKKGFFSVSGVFDHQHKHLQKLVIPVFKTLREGNKQDIETLTFRKTILKQYVHTAKQKSKGVKESFMTENEQTFGVEKLASMREERLRKMNESLYTQFIKRYKEQQEEVLRACVNIAAHSVKLLEKEKNMWLEVIQNSAPSVGNR